MFSLIAGPLCHRLGRKPVILIASLLFTVGALVMGFAVDKYALVTGRLIVGAGIGFASMSVPVYISEAAPSRHRGVLVGCNQLAIAAGQFVAACVAGAFAEVNPNGWKWMLGLSAVPSMVQLVGFSLMPESPRWLVSQDRLEEAKKILFQIRKYEDNTLKEMEDIMAAVQAENKFSNLNCCETILKVSPAVCI